MSKVTQLSAAAKPDGTELTTITLTVTPKQAQDWLDAMPTQRRLRSARVKMFERLIKEGRWQLSPHGLVFDSSGRIIDGQHRLTAIANSGKSVAVRATFNANESMFLVIDSGATPKGIEDALKHHGVQPELTMLLPASIRMLFSEERGHSPLTGLVHPSNEEAMEVFRAHPRLVEAGQMAIKVRVAPTRSLLVYYLYRGLLTDAAKTATFCEKLASGAGLFAGDPALLLRNTWFKDRASRVRRERSDQAAMIAHALNATLQGKKMLRWRGVEFGKGKVPQIGQ